jgi:hypothetical protein
VETVHQVDLVAHGFEHLAEALKHLRVRIQRLRFLEAVAVHVADGDDVRALGGDADVRSALAARAADAGDVEFFDATFLAEERLGKKMPPAVARCYGGTYDGWGRARASWLD